MERHHNRPDDSHLLIKQVSLILLDAEDERVQIRAAEAILDRAGVTKAKQISSTSAEREVGGKDNRSSTDRLLDDLSY